jgi:hypothetical protein
MNRSIFSLALVAGLMVSSLGAFAQQSYPVPNNPNIPNYSYPNQPNQPNQPDDEQQDEPMQNGQPQYPPQEQAPQQTPYQPQYQPGQPGQPGYQPGYQPQGQSYQNGQYAPGQYPPQPGAAADTDPVVRALKQTQRARRELRKLGNQDLAGHRAQAQALLEQAIQELKACQYYETH